MNQTPETCGGCDCYGCDYDFAALACLNPSEPFRSRCADCTVGRCWQQGKCKSSTVNIYDEEESVVKA